MAQAQAPTIAHPLDERHFFPFRGPMQKGTDQSRCTEASCTSLLVPHCSQKGNRVSGKPVHRCRIDTSQVLTSSLLSHFALETVSKSEAFGHPASRCSIPIAFGLHRSSGSNSGSPSCGHLTPRNCKCPALPDQASPDPWHHSERSTDASPSGLNQCTRNNHHIFACCFITI